MYKKDDNFHLWVIAGVAGAICRDIISTVFFWFGWIKYPIWAVASNIFVKENLVYTFGGVLTGLVADFTCAAFLGTVIGLLIDWRGTKYYWLKGAGVGACAWFVLYGIIFHDLPKTLHFSAKDPATNLISSFLHMFFGFAAAWVYVKSAKLKIRAW